MLCSLQGKKLYDLCHGQGVVNHSRIRMGLSALNSQRANYNFTRRCEELSRFLGGHLKCHWKRFALNTAQLMLRGWVPQYEESDSIYQ